MLNLRKIIIGLLAASGLGLVLHGAWIPLKAVLAQWLIEDAFEATLAGDPHPPWPWADTVPVARLSVPRLNASQIVLDAASPRNLAFGPTWLAGTPLPGGPGNTLISAHRDTHFAFLNDIQLGDTIQVETVQGQFWYQIEYSQVFSASQDRLTVQTAEDMLTLITCWPLDAIVPGGDERLAVFARRIPPDTVPSTQTPPEGMPLL